MARRALRAPSVQCVLAVVLRLAGANNCTCIFQGKDLPDDTVTNYPNQDPGKYQYLRSVRKYGTMCAAWDTVPETPWVEWCAPVDDWSLPTKNWCQIPWCYVGPDCESGWPSSVFEGASAARYSYEACGGYPNCYDDYFTDSRCPFDPWNSSSYKIFKPGCECLFHGRTLPFNVSFFYPRSHPGKYMWYPAIELYGTTCAAWDQSPGTPYKGSCVDGVEWCDMKYNWCQNSWCYVDNNTCPSAMPSAVFEGSSIAWYSYQACGTPDCYSTNATTGQPLFPDVCPADMLSTKWASNAANCSGFVQTNVEEEQAAGVVRFAPLPFVAGILAVVLL